MPRTPQQEAEDAHRVRLSLMDPLGYQRLRIIWCLGGHSTRSGTYFDLPADGDLLRAFRDYVADVNGRLGGRTDPVDVSLLAASRFLVGETQAADVVLDLLPERPRERDHGAGKCLVAAPQTVAGVLPLPSGVRGRADLWMAGSPEVAAVRAWLDEHRHRLLWQEAEGTYILAG